MKEYSAPVPPCVHGYTAYAVVPEDPESPVLGPFRIVDTYTLGILKAYIKDELGLTEEQYTLRTIVEVADDFFNFHPNPKGH